MRKSFKELCKEVRENREELKRQKDLIDFLIEHDRNDIVFNVPTNPLYNAMDYFLTATYINGKGITNAKITGNIWVENADGFIIAMPNKPTVTENTDEKFVVKVENKDNLFTPKYYRVTKHNGKVADVTEYYRQEEPTTVANPDTPTETDFTYFTAEQVRNMSQSEVKENYADIMKSMKLW